MFRVVLLAVLAALTPSLVSAQSPAPDEAALKTLLAEFLEGASRNDAGVHDRFWADDLIYTRAAGVRTGKAQLMHALRSAPPAQPDDPKTTYTGEDVRVQQYGDTAVVAFRLVGTTTDGKGTEVSTFLNTGTFVKRDGRWQAVAWQATQVPADTTPAKP